MLATSKNVLFPGHNHLLTTCKDKDKDPFIGLHEFVIGYSKAPEQPQSSARPICHSHAMTITGRELATIRIAASRSSLRHKRRAVLMTRHFDYHLSARWLWPGNRTYLEVASMLVTLWIVGFFAQYSLFWGNHSLSWSLWKLSRSGIMMYLFL